MMAALWQTIRGALGAERYVVGVHAAERLRERRIAPWQVVAGTLDGRLLAVREDAEPNPVIEIEIILAEGTAAKAVWSWNRHHALARLVTVHFFDR